PGRRGGPRPIELFSLPEPPFSNLRFDLSVRSDREIQIRNNLVSTKASADLHLGGTGKEPLLTGTVSTDEGDVSFWEASLILRSALVEFTASDPMDPKLQIVLGQTIRGYDITVTITGTLAEPEVSMDSSPPLERQKLFVLITTGYTTEEIGEQGAGEVAG